MPHDNKNHAKRCDIRSRSTFVECKKTTAAKLTENASALSLMTICNEPVELGNLICKPTIHIKHAILLAQLTITNTAEMLHFEITLTN